VPCREAGRAKAAATYRSDAVKVAASARGGDLARDRAVTTTRPLPWGFGKTGRLIGFYRQFSGSVLENVIDFIEKPINF
jgi:hypothetical protein